MTSNPSEVARNEEEKETPVVPKEVKAELQGMENQGMKVTADPEPPKEEQKRLTIVEVRKAGDELDKLIYAMVGAVEKSRDEATGFNMSRIALDLCLGLSGALLRQALELDKLRSVATNNTPDGKIAINIAERHFELIARNFEAAAKEVQTKLTNIRNM